MEFYAGKEKKNYRISNAFDPTSTLRMEFYAGKKKLYRISNAFDPTFYEMP